MQMTPHSAQLCVAAAAADSREAVLALTDAAGITRLDVPTVLCNGMPLTRFSLKYGNAKTEAMTVSAVSAGYVLRKSDSSPLTELCAAAAVSAQEYSKVLQQYFNGDRSVESELFCNGIPLKTFVRKYGAAEGRQVSQR
jgi:hypothetical protein